MQDPLTSSFRWGETFDTAPSSNQRDDAVIFVRQLDALERPYSGLHVTRRRNTDFVK